MTTQPSIIPLPTRAAQTSIEPAYSHDAEQATLGSLLLNREAIVAVAPWLEEADFFLAKHQWVYAAILKAFRANVPPDVRTVAEALRVAGQLDPLGGVLYLTDLVSTVANLYHVEHYAQIVVDLAWRRKAISLANKAIGQLHDLQTDPRKALLSIDTFAADIRRAMRHGRQTLRGRHISELWAKEFPPLKMIIPDILPEGLTLHSGKPKLGKSLLTVALASAVASGGQALNSVATEAGDVLYLCLEDPERLLQTRMEQAMHGRPDIRLWYETDWPALDAGGLDMIDNWCAAHSDARMVVIDTLARVQPAPDKLKSAYQQDYDSLTHLQRLAHARRVAIIGNTHSRKSDAADVIDEVSGTSGRTGAVDNIWVLRRARGEQMAELHITLRELGSMTRELQFDPATAAWTLGGDAQEARLSSLKVTILDALADGPQYPRDLAELVEGDRAQVRKQLQSLKRQGMVKADERGRYELIDSDPRKNSGSEGSGGSEDQGSESKPRRIRGFRPFGPGAEVENPDETTLIPDPCDPSDPPDPPDPLDALLTSVPPRDRFYLRMRLRSQVETDQTTAKERCEQWGVDYEAAKQIAQRQP